jgi:hypothetical protein
MGHLGDGSDGWDGGHNKVTTVRYEPPLQAAKYPTDPSAVRGRFKVTTELEN